MQTFEEQRAFFKEQWPEMKAAAESGGAETVIEFIQGFDDKLERRVLYMFANQGLVNQEWEGKSFDVYIAVCDAGIAEFLRQAEAADDEETRDKRTDGANIISYNLSADLAECWPGDELPRERQHFERGLKAAEDCIRWREELGKPAGPFSMAYWAHGMHSLSLGELEASVESFAKSLDYAREAAAAEGLPVETSAETSFSMILGAGYLGLARWVAGDGEGQELYEQAIAAFKAQCEDRSKADDAQFGIDQLEVVKAKYVK